MAETVVDLQRQMPAPAVPLQDRGEAAEPSRNRIVRQIEGIDAWNASRRRRELDLVTCRSRLDREFADRQRDALCRTQEVIQQRTADELAREVNPMSMELTTAVIAHRHEWFVQKLHARLVLRGVTVIACTDNAADALGVVIAEQPDLVFAGDRLAMLPGDALLAEVALFAPATLRAVQVDVAPQAGALASTADEVFLRACPPSDVADALSTLCCAGSRERERA